MHTRFQTQLNCVSRCKLVCLGFPQFDADRDEDAVFRDISMAVDSKLFPHKEAPTGKSPHPSASERDQLPDEPGHLSVAEALNEVIYLASFFLTQK